VGGEAADSRAVGPAVVVHDDDEPEVLGRGDVVQRLPGHPAGQAAVTDQRHHVPVLAAQPVRLRQPVGVREGGRGVRVLHDVVLGLGPARVAGQPPGLPQRVEGLRPAGQQLVHVRLVAGIEDHPVPRRVEHPVHRQGDLHHAQVRAEVAAGPGHGLDQHVADLQREVVELLIGQPSEVPRSSNRLQHAHRAPPQVVLECMSLCTAVSDSERGSTGLTNLTLRDGAGLHAFRPPPRLSHRPPLQCSTWSRHGDGEDTLL
jgi:hypothetical protein